MTAITLRRNAYRLAGLLGCAYVIYVLALKFSGRMVSGPLGEVGEFCLVLASVTFFSIGLFADEVARRDDPH
ncbi:MAG: hypothetical protein ABI564_02985 [Ideonella sp.]